MVLVGFRVKTNYLLFFSFSIFFLLLGVWYMQILPNSRYSFNPIVSQLVREEKELRWVYSSKDGLKILEEALGNDSPLAMRFQTNSRRFPALASTKKGLGIYYTVNDWALAVLDSMPIKDLYGSTQSLQVEVAKLKYSDIRPIYGQQDDSDFVNAKLIQRWRILLRKLIES